MRQHIQHLIEDNLDTIIAELLINKTITLRDVLKRIKSLRKEYDKRINGIS